MRKVRTLPPELSPFDIAASVFGVAHARLVILYLQITEEAVVWGIERKVADARRLGVNI